MRQGKYLAFAAICGITVLICGCGKDDGGKSDQSAGSTAGQTSQGSVQEAPAQAPAQAPAATGGAAGGISSPAGMAKVEEQNRELLTKMNQGKDIKAVTTDTIKVLLPETLAGMKRTSASAEQNQMMGINMTRAEGQFEGENGASINFSVTDVGNMSGPMRMGMAGWTMAQYDRQTDTGYEKTATYSGYKGMEEYDTQSKYGAIRVFVGDRFIVELEGNDITMDTLKQALGQIDLKKMASLASGS